jgi:hypothetical protein
MPGQGGEAIKRALNHARREVAGVAAIFLCRTMPVNTEASTAACLLTGTQFP